MGSVKYDSSNYDAAKAKYDELAKKYEGVAGLKIAQEQGSNIAESAGKSAARSSTAAARSSGMNKAQSALAGMGASSKAASENYGTGVSTALNKQNTDLANRSSLIDKAASVDKAKYDGKVANKTANASLVGTGLGAAATVIGAAIASDETLKNLYPDMGDDILDAFRKIRSCEFNYTPEAQEMAETETLPGVDADEHMGVAAQDVEAVLPDAVIENENGHKLVDTNEMTLANTAAIAELARKVKELEEKL